MAESGIEFVQSNLAELLDGGGQPLAIFDPKKGALGFIRSLVSYIPGLADRLAKPVALFSLDFRASKDSRAKEKLSYSSLKTSVALLS